MRMTIEASRVAEVGLGEPGNAGRLCTCGWFEGDVLCHAYFWEADLEMEYTAAEQAERLARVRAAVIADMPAEQMETIAAIRAASGRAEQLASDRSAEGARAIALRNAKVLYEVYAQAADGKNCAGLPMPIWDALPIKIQNRWAEVAEYARGMFR